jgi:hypothetical protein
LLNFPSLLDGLLLDVIDHDHRHRPLLGLQLQPERLSRSA